MDSKILEIGGGGLDVTGLDRRSKFISEQLEFWISSVNMHQIALIALQHILCYWIVS